MLRTIRHLLEMIRFSHTLFALPFALLAAVMAWTTPGVVGRKSEVGGQRSEVGGQRSEVRDPRSEVGDRRSEGQQDGARLQTAELEPPTSDLRLPTSDFRPPTSYLAPPPFRWQHLAGILICMVAARSAAMAFNRLADRRLDARNPRTSSRHLPAGILTAGSVAAFTLAASVAFVAGTLLFLPNRWPLWLSVPVLLYLLAYSYTKRFTALAHFWLGAALMLAPVSVWIALRGELLADNPSDILPAVLLGAAVLMWVAGFDMIYACQDADFDRQARLKSVPATIGVAGSLRLAAACHLITLILLATLPIACPQVPLGWVYGAAVGIVALLLVWEHLLVRPDDLTRVNLAFFNINVGISLGLLVAGTIDLVT